MTNSTTSCTKSISVSRFANMALDIGELLIASGAHCGRINRNIQRFADRWQLKVDLFISFTVLSITVTNIENPEETITVNRKATTSGVHFGILTSISLLSWRVFESNLSVEETEKEIKDIRNTPRHSTWLVRLGIGLACASLCILAGGNHINAFFAFIAATVGLIVKQSITHRKFNPMIAILLAAFVTTMISGIDMYFGYGLSPETTVATSVLYLIPGVPLINCVIDLFEGYIPTAIARGTFGGFVLLCIAVGMSLSITLIGINNF